MKSFTGEVCPLCEGNSNFFGEFRKQDYFQCETCRSVFLHKIYYLNSQSEKDRYLLHHNDIQDQNYRNFVAPIIQSVLSQIPLSAIGLDFGSGPTPIVSKLLSDNGYLVEKYDPYFAKDESVLNQKYDYIVACEVIEHFQNPQKEFSLLRSLLKEKGKLFCKTSLFTEEIDFQNWYYKNDPTHVFFYHLESLDWIRGHLDFKNVYVKNSVIQFDL